MELYENVVIIELMVKIFCLEVKGTHNQSQKYSDPNYQKPIFYPHMFYKSYSWHT